jgi:hypothetical protein
MGDGQMTAASGGGFDGETSMKIVAATTAICIAMTPVASAQKGGYPASPSHAVTGTNPDGTPRYGGESGKEADPSAKTVGRSDPDASDDRGRAHGAGDAIEGNGTPGRSGNTDRR